MSDKARMQWKHNGFTLMELMVVIILMALALGMVVPRIGGGQRRMSEKKFIMTVVREINRARLKSMATMDETVFYINPENRTFGLDSEKGQKIPENVDVFSRGLEQTDAGLFVLRFFPDGSCKPTKLEITFNDNVQYFILVDPFFGVKEETRGNKS